MQSYVARRGPIDAEDLRGHAVIGFDASMATLPAAQWLADRRAAADVVLRGREMIDLVTAAVAGLGVAVLWCLAADREPTLVRLTDGPVATRELALVYRRESGGVPAVRAVIDELAEIVNLCDRAHESISVSCESRGTRAARARPRPPA